MILHTIEPQVKGTLAGAFLRSLGPSKRQNLTVRVTLGECVERYCHIKFGASAGWKRPKHVNKNYVGGGGRGGGGGVFVFTTYGLFLPKTLEGEMTIVLSNMSQQFQARESRQ